MRFLIRATATCVCLALCCGLGFAQTGNATLRGTVMDATGAVIPGARVVVTNAATGVTKTTVTTASGLYDMPYLIPGSYVATVTSPGFATKNVTNIPLAVDQKATLDIQLEVGPTTQQVTVSGTTVPLLQAAEGGVGTVVDSQQVQDLPLNGRNFTQLEELSAGTVRTSHTNTYGSFNGNASPITSGDQRNMMPAFDVNGQDAQWTFYRLDGIEDNERSFGGANIAFSMDAIKEFKVQTADFSAEYGRSPVQVDIVTKSGTNMIHGTLYEFLRNDALDAAQWEFTGPHVKNILKRNQFGGNIGGPIKKDKLFYFLSYDGTREDFSSPTLASVPTDAMRSGIFPAGDIIFDPLTQQPFPSNTIPQSRWDAISQKVVPFMPASNIAGTANTSSGGLPVAPSNNYFFDPRRLIKINQGNLRVDYNRSANNSFFGRYTYSPLLRKGDGPLATNINGSIIFGENDHFGGQNLSSGWFHNFGPYTINELRGGFSTDPMIFDIYDTSDYASQLGLTQILQPDATKGFPNFVIGSVTIGSGQNRPDRVGDKEFQVVDTLTLVRGPHSIRLGGEVRRVDALTDNTEISKGNFTFNGAQTRDRTFPTTSTTYCPGGTNAKGCSAGNGWGDFLLGFLSQAQKGDPIPLIPKYYSDRAGFVNDLWRVRENFTLNLGLRYEYETRTHANPPYFSLPVTQNGEFTGTVAVANDSHGNISTLASPAALALQTGGTVVTCRQAGLPDNCQIAPKGGWQPRVGFAWKVTPQTVVRGGGGMFIGQINGDDIIEACEAFPLILTITTASYSNAPSGSAPPPLSLSGNPFTGTNNAQTWQNCMPPNVKNPSMYQWNVAVERALGSKTNLTVAYVGDAQRHLSNDQFGQTVKFNMPRPVGVVLAPGQVQTVAHPGFGVIPLHEQLGTASYQSLQATLRRTVGKGISYVVTYTYSKNLVYVPWLSDSLDTKVDRGPWGDDLTHNLVIAPIWQLPFGRGQRWAPGSAVLNKLVSGWEANTIVSVHGGFPFTPILSPDVDLLHQNGNVAMDRPNRICNGKLSNPTPFQWFNPACFVLPTEPTTPGSALIPGSSGFAILRGPGTFAEDLGLLKTTAINERVSMQFRAELFNVFNHPVLGLPATGINPSASLSTEGQITAPDSLPRIIQFALKLQF